MTCPSCGREVSAEFAFCPHCAAPLAPAAADRREERKVVTVLFCDLVGFTQRAEQLDPEDVRSLLRGYHDHLRREFERYGGTVEKFIGDAVVAVFGAPVAHEDDPERAVRAALAVREWAREQADVDVRIAVNTGEALVTVGARPEHGEGMVAGDVVNTAARLQAHAPTNGILVGEPTHRATRDRIDYRDAEPVHAKGKAEPVRVWEVVEARSRLGVDVVHASAAPLFGRDAELALLVDALSRARRECEPQLVTLIGVPGIGKSRLVYELMQRAAEDPELIRWRQGRCLPYGEGVTFWALGEIVKSHAGIFETDEADRAEAKLRAAVADLVSDEADRAWIETQLRPLVGLTAAAAALDERESEAVTAWIRFFEALADDVPLVLVVEDLHWADDKLLDFVDELVDRATDAAILVVATARPELLGRRPSWGGGKANAVTLSLSPLADDDTARLLAALLDRSVLPAETQRAVLARAGGNPLFAEQYARMLEEHDDPRELPVPETVQGLIAARIDGLAPAEKALLQDASVHGKVFWDGAVAAMRRVDRETIAPTVRSLERKEFLRRHRRSSVAAETEYTFRHALLRDVAYGQIPRAERADKHRRAAEWLDALAQDRDDHVELLADHYVRALELATAAGRTTEALARAARLALRDAAARASRLHAFAATVRFAEQALALWPEADPERPPLLALRAKALHYLSDSAAIEALEEARDALVDLGDRGQAGELEALVAEAWWHRGSREHTNAHLARARSLVADAPTSRGKAHVISQVARYGALAGDGEGAIAAGEEALAMAKALGDEELQGHALNNIAIGRTHVGDLDGALAAVQRAVELTTAANSPEAARSYNNLAYVLGRRGDQEGARRAGDEADRVAERFGDEQMLRFRRASEAWEHFMEGDWGRASSLADEFIAQCEAGSSHYQETSMREIRAIIRSWRGDDAGALDDARRAVELGREARDPQAIVGALLTALAVDFVAGRERDARAYALELLGEQRAYAVQHGGALFWLAATAGVLGLDDEVREALVEAPDVWWADAARETFAGDWRSAAEAYDGKLGPPHAFARLQAAKSLVSDGRRAEADEQLRQALAFFRQVGAARFVRESEGLLAASA